MMQYVQDYDGKYFARYFTSNDEYPGKTYSTNTWQPPVTNITSNADWFLEPYVKSRQLFICPSYSGNGGTNPYGYAYNLVAGVPYLLATPINSHQVLSESVVQEPSQMVAFLDSSFASNAYPANSSNWPVSYCGVYNTSSSPCPTGEALKGRHFGGQNAVFMDGHAKWNKIEFYRNAGQNYPVWQGWQ